MSDSYVLGRSQAKVKRRKPPKRPWRGSSRPLPNALILAGALLYYAAASQGGVVVIAALYGVTAILAAEHLWRWWRWRVWARWTSKPIWWGPKEVDVIDWCLAAFIWGNIIWKLAL